jgi:hypothetical protein
VYRHTEPCLRRNSTDRRFIEIETVVGMLVAGGTTTVVGKTNSLVELASGTAEWRWEGA